MEQHFKPGLTWRSTLALIAAALIVAPASIYISMIGGGTLALSSAFVIAIILSELTRLSANPLTKQELFITYEAANIIAAANAAGIGFYWIIFRLFYITNPISWAFKINGVPIPLKIPDWLAPPLGSSAYYARTLFHPDLFKAEIVFTTFTLLYLVAELAMVMITTYTFVEIEKLEFPLSKIDVSLVETLAEREPEQLQAFTLSIYPGALYGLILVALPILAGITFVPLPWIDVTPLIEPYFPGAIFGIATDLTPWIAGFLVPFNAATGMILGSLATWTIGNYVFLKVFPKVFPEWVMEYRQGMNIGLLWSRSHFRIWFAPQIGLSFALAAVVVLRFYKSIIRAFKAFIKAISLPATQRTFPPLPILIIMYLGGTITSAIIHNFLTGFPLWISIPYTVGLSFMMGMASTAAMGETGYTIPLPYVWHTIVYFSPYNEYSGWVIAPVLAGTSAPGWTNMMKACYLTETRPMDLLKAIIMSIVLTQIIGIISLDFFWRIAPIPSSAYPFTLNDWARIAIGDSLLITRAIRIDAKILGGSFIIGVILISIFEFLHTKFGIPISGAGFVVGTTTLTPFSVSLFLGSIISTFFMPRYFGKEKWERIRGAIAAGILVGYGIVIGLTVAVAFIMNSSWLWPW